jgi:hypothetical protein
MTSAPELLLAHHLKTLRLPTYLREHDKQARICAAECADPGSSAGASCVSM